MSANHNWGKYFSSGIADVPSCQLVSFVPVVLLISSVEKKYAIENLIG